MQRFWLVRHGITIWNKEGRLQGHTDIPLAELGLEQAQRAADRLADEQIDAVWSSDLLRASQTAEAIAARHGLTVRPEPLLREIMLGEWEGLNKEEIIARGDGELFEAYRHDPIANRPPGGERLEHVWDRLCQGFQKVRDTHPQGAVVIAGHGGSLRALLCDALGAPLTSLRRLWLDNASLSLIEIDGPRIWVRKVNDTSHLAGLAEPPAHTIGPSQQSTPPETAKVEESTPE